MKNRWLVNKIVAKGEPFYTFEIYDEKKDSMICETVVDLEDKPSLRVIEQLEESKGVWKPVCIVWEKVELTYTDEKFLEGKGHIRLLEVGGENSGILRQYDKHGEHVESWVMHGLKLTDIEFPEKTALKATFEFHHAMYFCD